MGGRRPRTGKEVLKLTLRCGLSCRYLRKVSSRNGELVGTSLREWTIFYSAWLRDDQKVLVILHEMGEWHCLTQSPELILRVPGGVYGYDGSDHPQDVSLLIALYTERLYARACYAPLALDWACGPLTGKLSEDLDFWVLLLSCSLARKLIYDKRKKQLLLCKSA